MKITTKKLEKSEVEILGTLEAVEFEKYEDKALQTIGERLELPGFRKGKAPTNIIKENTPEMELLEEMAEKAINEIYPKILEENKIDAIGRPQITITKIAKGSDLEFKIISAVLPEMKLPDYKKISKEQNLKEDFKKEIIVDDAEIEKTILELRKMRAEQKHQEQKKKTAKIAEDKTSSESEKKGREVKDENKKEETKETQAPAESKSKTTNVDEEIPESEYPEFNDEFAKSFGNFKTAVEFREKIKSNLKLEKETKLKDKLRLSIVEEIIKNTEGEIPEILIQSETEKILYKLQADIANMGFKFEDYLKQINKTEGGLKKEWRPDAENRAKLQMIIQKIAQEEKLKPTEEEIKKDLDNIVKMYKGTDPVRARAYVEQMLENEKVFAFLEKQ